MSGDSAGLRIKSSASNRRILQQQSTEEGLMWIPETPTATSNLSKSRTPSPQRPNEISVTSTTTATVSNVVEIEIQRETPGTPPPEYANITTIITTSSSIDTISGGDTKLSGPSSPSNLSSITLVGSTGASDRDLTPTADGESSFRFGRAPSSPLPERKRKTSEALTEAQIEMSKKDETVKPKEVKVTPVTETKKSIPDTTTSVSSKPTIVSTIAKKPGDANGRSLSPSRTSGGLQPNMSYLTMNRRPSAGANVIPVAALCQHRHSLQLNNSDFGLGHRVNVNAEHFYRRLFFTFVFVL